MGAAVLEGNEVPPGAATKFQPPTPKHVLPRKYFSRESDHRIRVTIISYRPADRRRERDPVR